MATATPICTTEKDITDHFGQVCTVVGTYEIKPFRNQRGGLLREWPVVVLAQGHESVQIESIWDESKMPSADTIAQHRGRKVEVVGMLHGSPPGRIANMVVPCISPVQSIRVLPD